MFTRIATLIIGLLLTTGAVAAAAPPTAPVGVGAGLGCSAQCIKKAWVTPTMTGGSLEVKTDTAAKIKIWVSDQAPGYINGKPWVPHPDDYLETHYYYFSHTFSLDSLTAGTLYHIVVSATDHEGRTAYQVGTFKTLDPPPLPPSAHHEAGRTVLLTLWKVEIRDDADHDCCVTPNRGEIRFDYFLQGERRHRNDEKKRATGSSFRPRDVSSPISLENAPQIIAVRVLGRERDATIPTSFDSSGAGGWGCDDTKMSGVVWNVSCAHLVFDLDNLHDEVPDGDYGGMPFGHDAYFVFESPDEDYLEFRVYAWVDVIGE